MSRKYDTVDNASNLIRSQTERFRTLYSKGVEGNLVSNGKKVFLWTLQLRFTKPELVQELDARLGHYLRTLRVPPVIRFGVDRRGVPFILTHWMKLEPVMLTAKNHNLLGFEFWQMVRHVARLHKSGMPFGDIAEDSFLRDENGRVYLCGIPAYGFPVPKDRLTDTHQNYLAPEHSEGDTTPLARDIFALGAYAHQLFTRRPFPKTIDSFSMETQFKEKTKPLLDLYPDLPANAEEVLRCTLRWSPEERIECQALLKLAAQSTTPGERARLAISGIVKRNWKSNLTFSRPSARVIAYCSLSLVGLIVLVATFSWRASVGPVAREKTAPASASGSLAALEAGLGQQDPLISVASVSSKVANAFGGAVDPKTAKPQPSPGSTTSVEFRSIPELIQFAEQQDVNAIRQSVLSAAPTASVISLLLHSKDLPRDQFENAGRELLSRRVLSAAGRIGLLALLRFSAEEISDEQREALLRTIDESTLLRDVKTFASWRSENALLVLTAVIAVSGSREIIYSGFSALSSAVLRIEPLASLIALIKSERWMLSMREMKAIAVLALAEFATEVDFSLALRHLGNRMSPIALQYFLASARTSDQDAPWCAALTISGR